MKVIMVFVLLIAFLCGLQAHEHVERCWCEGPIENRVACAAGKDIAREECERNHCCYSGTQGNYPSCFERRERCSEDKCKVSPSRRRPCGSWQLGKAHCDSLNCCYDHRMFPYCYYSTDDVPFQKQKKFKSSSTDGPNSNFSDDKNDFVIVDSHGANSAQNNSEKSHVFEVECSSKKARKPCANIFVSREACMEMDCCWAPSPSQPSCFHKTATTVDNTDGYLTDLEKLFEAYISVARLDEPETNLPPDVEKETDEKEFGDQEVSTLIECLNMEVIGISQAFCEASDRKSCLDSSCCWNGTHCLRAVTDLSNNTDNISIYNVRGTNENTTDAVFVNINVHENVGNRTPACDRTKAILSCGSVSINKTTCLKKGCCWMPELARQGREDMLCSLPVLTDDVPQEQPIATSDNLPTLWSEWQPWSACYATKPCSNKAERQRERKCVRNKNVSSKHIRGGCTLQAEEFEKIPCYHPTECNDTKWSDWGPWSACSLSCGGFGIRQRHRECAKGDELEKNRLCEATHSAFTDLIAETQLKECLRGVCPR